MSTPRRQSHILAARYWDCLLGDMGGLVLVLAQAPLIGWLCAVVWGSIERDTPALYFVLCLAALWFGCINACREIVKERAILERERLFGLRPGAYLASKVWVLAALGAAQVVLLQGTVEWHLQLRGPMPLELLALFGASLAGTGLGLLVSALATTQERAVFAVPLLLLPQILFSELAIPIIFIVTSSPPWKRRCPYTGPSACSRRAPPSSLAGTWLRYFWSSCWPCARSSSGPLRWPCSPGVRS